MHIIGSDTFFMIKGNHHSVEHDYKANEIIKLIFEVHEKATQDEVVIDNSVSFGNDEKEVYKSTVDIYLVPNGSNGCYVGKTLFEAKELDKYMGITLIVNIIKVDLDHYKIDYQLS